MTLVNAPCRVMQGCQSLIYVWPDWGLIAFEFRPSYSPTTCQVKPDASQLLGRESVTGVGSSSHGEVADLGQMPSRSGAATVPFREFLFVGSSITIIHFPTLFPRLSLVLEVRRQDRGFFDARRCKCDDAQDSQCSPILPLCRSRDQPMAPRASIQRRMAEFQTAQ